MEIQTFLLAEHVTANGYLHDVRRAGLNRIDCTEAAQFPVRLTIPAMFVLRRENTLGDAPVRVRFDLVDEDGQPAGQPRRLVVAGNFPAGNRFFHVMAKIHFEFPRPGRYRLDITSDDEVNDSVYHYAIDILPPGQV